MTSENLARADSAVQGGIYILALSKALNITQIAYVNDTEHLMERCCTVVSSHLRGERRGKCCSLTGYVNYHILVFTIL